MEDNKMTKKDLWRVPPYVLTLKSKLISTTAYYTYIVIALIFAFAVGWTTSMVSDVLWGTRDGLDQLAQGGVTWKDNWSWYVPEGNPEKLWTNNSWGWSWLLGAFYSVGGITGLRFFSGLTALAIAGLVLLITRKLGVAPLYRVVSALGVTLLLAPFISARAQVADYIILLLFMLSSLYLRSSNLKLISRLVIGFAMAFILLVLWQNMHLSGLFAIALFVGVWFVTQDMLSYKVRFISSIALAVSVYPTLYLTPYGAEGVNKSSEVLRVSIGFFTEWMPISQWISLLSLTILAIIVGLVAYGLRNGRTIASLMILTVLILGCLFYRFMPYALLISLLILIPPTQMLKEKSEKIIVPVLRRVKILKILGGSVAALVAGSLLSSIFISFSHIVSHGDSGINDPNFAMIPEGSRVLTDPNGAAVILMRPDLLVAIDGRGDFYKQEGWNEAEAILSPPDFKYITVDRDKNPEEWLEQELEDQAFLGKINSNLIDYCIDAIYINSSFDWSKAKIALAMDRNWTIAQNHTNLTIVYVRKTDTPLHKEFLTNCG